jgi:hypothetical protein
VLSIVAWILPRNAQSFVCRLQIRAAHSACIAARAGRVSFSPSCARQYINTRFLQTRASMAMFRGMQQVSETVHAGAAVADVRFSLMLPFSSPQLPPTFRSCTPFAPRWTPLAPWCRPTPPAHLLPALFGFTAGPPARCIYLKVQTVFQVESIKKDAFALKVAKQVRSRRCCRFMSLSANAG